MAGLPERPIPIRSGASSRLRPTRGMTLRHRCEEAGLPCRKTSGAPLPESW
jgi:hypothetical protein